MKPRLVEPHRIVVKVGTSSLTAADGTPDPHRIGRLADQVATLRGKGVDLVVVSSGAIAAGMAALGLERRPTDMPTLQAAAAVGQRRLMDLWAEFLEAQGRVVGQVLLTQQDIVQRAHYVNARNTLDRLLELGAIPIVNENDTVAVEEIRYGENDRISALVANIVRADLLVLLSDVEGLYTDHPSVPGASLISTVPEVTPEVVALATTRRSSLGSGGMASKLEAARIARLSGVATVIALGERPDGLLDVWAGEPVGTYVPAKTPRLAARKLWIAWAPAARGRIVVDDGARRAVSHGNKSLLAAGVRAVEGTFKAGDAVEVVGPEGQVVAKGLVSFDSDLLVDIIGTKGGREVIHRDHLVVL
ncbi:MAG TPA: glutamate 5-kinase [Actinomycetota bacterium]|nr:glutamate 5-kinase [Actinomycetota bacterium]